MADDALVQLALSMYADEPCRVCGRLLTMNDLNRGAVFAGYNRAGTARAAHKRCWDNFVEMLQDFLGPAVDVDAVIAAEFDRRRASYGLPPADEKAALADSGPGGEEA